MKVWEAKLAGRKNAVEFNLANYRERWWIANNMREDLLKGTESYQYFTERMVDMESRISDMLDELEFINGLFGVGPVIGEMIALVVRRSPTGQKLDVPKTRSLLNIIEDKAIEYENNAGYEDLHKAEGLREACNIICNPYEYLTPEEQTEYDKVEPEATAAIPKSAASPTSAQIARNMIDELRRDDDGEHETIMRVKRSEPRPTVEELEDQVDDDDVVVRRR